MNQEPIIAPLAPEAADGNYLAIKGRFKTALHNLYGQFILIFNSDRKAEVFNAVLSTYSDLYTMEPHTEWNQLEEYISNVRFKGNFNKNMTAALFDQYKHYSGEMTGLQILYDNAYNYNYTAVDTALFDLINRVIRDKDLAIETVIQEVTPVDFTRKRQERATGGSAAQQGEPARTDLFLVEEDAVILTVKPIVSPVRGKPLYELRAGDRLMINIPPTSGRATMAIDSLGLREQDGIRPVAAQVVDIKAGSQKNDPVEILTIIAKGIYGKFTEDQKQVKLRMYNPSLDGPLGGRGKKSSKAVEKPDESPISRGAVIMLVLFVIILLIFIVLIVITL